MSNKVILPGSFDPITLGHLDIIKRIAKTYEEIIIVIGQNVSKTSLFSPETRKEIIEKIIENYKLTNVKVEISDELIVDYANKVGANAIIRGLRNGTDFEYEQFIAYNNLHLNEEIETIFYLARPEHLHISSSGVKEILKFNHKVDNLVPSEVLDYIKGKNEDL